MPVHVAALGAVRVITMDRPQRRNAIDPEMSAQLGRAFTDAADDPQTRVVVLTGAGQEAFSAGMDLRAFRDRDRATPPAQASGPGIEVLTEHYYPKPVIAALNGSAMGGGLGMALACDLLVAAEHAMLGIPEVQRGLVGVGVTSRAALRLPPAAISELALTGEPIGARRALALGLVNRVVPGSEVLTTAQALAARIAANGPLAVQAAKAIVADVAHLHDGVDLPALRARAEPVTRSNDAKEGAAAFLERRSPHFTGR